MTLRPVAIYLGGLLIAYFVVLIPDCGLIDAGRPDHLLLRLAGPFIELGLAFSVATLLGRDSGGSDRGRWRTTAAFALPAIIGFVYVAQTLTLHMSDNFLTVLALENHAEGRLVRGWSFYIGLGFGVAWIAVFAWITRREKVSPTQAGARARWAPYTSVVLLVLFAWLVAFQENNGRLEASYRQAPLASLLHTVAKLYKTHASFGTKTTEEEIVNRASLSQGRFPFEKTTIFHRDLPFAKAENAPRTLPNVIIIFTEGMSARLIGAYGSKLQGLTPNVDRLAQRSMRVDNYFNHTAATYRGLQGQLTSGYPEAGGADETLSWDKESSVLRQIHYQSLPLLLRDVGYESYFFSPHSDRVALNDLLRMIGFGKVFTLESGLSHSTDAAARMTGTSLNDRDLFGEMVDFLKKRDEDHDGHPLLVGAYDIGTHAFFGIGATGKKFNDGTNIVLDRFHNYDAELGQFLDYFFASPYAKNTILIFTADHATYPEPAFREIAGTDYKPYFVDRIPLLIYDPFHRLPPAYDARGRTSLSLAPTVMQLVGIPTGLNSFMGRTLFSNRKHTFGMAAIGQEFYATDSSGVYNEIELPPAYRAEFDQRKEIIELYYHLERENRVFNPAQ